MLTTLTMLSVSPELLERTAEILGTDGISDEEIESKIFALAQDFMLARRLIDWLPEAFGIVFIPHMAKVNVPTTFSAKSKDGRWIEFKFGVEPIFEGAVRLGMEMYHCGHRGTFRNIVSRSSTLDAVNRALNQGDSIEGATLSGPVLIGVPAEVYMPQAKPLWRRLFN
jgi:hypothetical protein